MMSKKYFGSIAVSVAILGSLSGVILNAPEAQAGCGWLDPTCRSGPNDCLFGACPRPRQPQSTVGRDMTPTAPLWIDNHSGRTVHSMYLSPASNSSWGEDILGQGTLGAGRRFNMSVRDVGGCIYDFKAVLDNGAVRTLRGFNACSIGGVNVLP